MRFRALLFTLVMSSGVAYADLTTRALDEAGAGPQPASVDNNLLSWAGPVKQTSLPDLLQIAVRQAPALQTAKLDIEIAEAQIQQTWSRRDWVFTAEAQAAWSGSGPVVWEMPGAASPLPDWLPEVGEAVAGLRLNNAGLPERVESGALPRLRERLAANPETNRYAQWARWFVADPATRAVSPSAGILADHDVSGSMRPGTE